MNKIIVGLMAASLPIAANATALTTTSPTNGALPSGVTAAGGIVVDMKGVNGVRVVSQLSADSLYVGYAGSNPQVIGTQTGFTPAILSALGGGLQSIAFRLTLYDGDTASGNFDFNDNTFLVNSTNFGNWSAVATDITDNSGTTSYFTTLGFPDSQLATGWFSSTDSAAMTSLFTSMSASNSLQFALIDADWGDNYYDFRQGLSGGLVSVGTGPTISPAPEPTTWAMLILGFLGTGAAMRARKSRPALRYV